MKPERLLITLACTALLSVGVTGTASAEAKFHYNSDIGGAYVSDTGMQIADFSTLRYDTKGPKANGSDGLGQLVKNNAASIDNRSAIYGVVVYYNSWWSGPAQAVDAGTWANLNSQLKNNNASSCHFDKRTNSQCFDNIKS